MAEAEDRVANRVANCGRDAMSGAQKWREKGRRKVFVG